MLWPTTKNGAMHDVVEGAPPGSPYLDLSHVA